MICLSVGEADWEELPSSWLVDGLMQNKGGELGRPDTLWCQFYLSSFHWCPLGPRIPPPSAGKDLSLAHHPVTCLCGIDRLIVSRGGRKTLVRVHGNETPRSTSRCGVTGYRNCPDISFASVLSVWYSNKSFLLRMSPSMQGDWVSAVANWRRWNPGSNHDRKLSTIKSLIYRGSGFRTGLIAAKSSVPRPLVS